MNESNPSTQSGTPLGWRAYFELLRLPAVFTAIADVMMGYLVTQGNFQPPWAVALLITASSLIYLAGMVLNDVHDVDVDAVERPQRPIPSGRVSLASAQRLGWGMLASGVIVAWLVGYLAGNFRPGVVATLLAAAAALYDVVLKRTAVAPLVMGSCRFLNVLLGMSLAETTDTMLPRAWTVAEWTVAAGIGIYIAGLTIFARSEARETPRWRLMVGILVMAAGIATLAFGALRVGNESHYRWIVWLLIGAYVLIRHSMALFAPVPRMVQLSVRHALRMLIFLDFIVAFEAAPHSAGSLIILLLFLPMLLLEYWFSTT
jgi:4-hydroxybenzoate polyprenyltransferase